MFEGKLVRLRAVRREDIKNSLEFFGDPEVLKNVRNGIPFPLTEKDEEKFLDGISGMNDTYGFSVETLDGKYIGNCGINKNDHKNSIATIGIFIGDKKYWGQGYGSDALKLLVDFIFMEMNMNKISLDVFSFNKRAIRCYEKNGFKVEGIFKQDIFRGGEYHDTIAMAILRDEWKDLYLGSENKRS